MAVAATLGMSVSYVDRQTLAAIAPAVRAALAIDHAEFGWLLSGFSLAYLAATPLAGAVLDRVGARRGFAAAVLVWSAVAGGHALVTSFAMLFAFRVLLGLAESPSFPAAAQAIRRALPDRGRPAAYGLLFTGSSLGAMVAAPLAVALERRFGFRLSFAGTALVGFAWVPLWLAVTRGGSIAAARPAPSGERAFFSWFETIASAPVLRALVAIAGSAPALMFVLNWTSQYLVEAWHVPKGNVGGFLVLPPLLFDAGAVFFGWVASRRPLRTHTDLLTMSALFAALLAAAPLAPSVSSAVGLLALSAAGGGGIYVLVTADMLGRVPAARASSASGMTAAAQSLAYVIAGPLVGRVVDRSHGYDAALIALGVVVLPTTLAFALWPLRTSAVAERKKA